MIDIAFILNQIDDVMYFPILIIVMAIAGLYFTIKTRGVQIRLFGESMKILLEPPGEEGAVSSLQAMLVSTASRVGTGNIIGVSNSNLSRWSGIRFLDLGDVYYRRILSIH